MNSASSNHNPISLMDALGRTVVRQPVQIQKGMNTNSVNVSSLAPGAYIVKMNGLSSTRVQVIK